jgi:hypothetical protein
MKGKKVVSVFLILIGIAVAMPFNYIYGIEVPGVDLVWAAIGIAMISFGVYSLKKERNR